MEKESDVLQLAPRAWTGIPYAVEVTGGAPLLKWANQALAVIIGRQLVFGADGSVCIDIESPRKGARSNNMRPRTILGTITLRWRWDAPNGRMLINFYRRDRPLDWRWDELKADGDVTSLVSKWYGVAHVGLSTFSYTLSLNEDSAPRDTSLSGSLLVDRGSLIEESFRPSLASSLLEASAVEKIVNQYDDYVEHQKAHIQSTLEIIDRMWLQELVLQCQAEILTVLIAGMSRVEHGAEPHELFESTLAGVQRVRTVAFESLNVRADARETVALDGGLEAIRLTLTAQLEETENDVKPLIDKLVEPLHVSQARVDAENMLSRVMDEFEAIYSLKEANSNTFMQLQDDMHELQDGEESFVETMIQVARANPQNASLQKTCIQALIFRERNGSLDKCIDFLAEHIEAEHIDTNADCKRLLETSCKAVVHLVEHFETSVEMLRQKGFEQKLTNIIVKNPKVEPIRASACSALLAILAHRDETLVDVTDWMEELMKHFESKSVNLDLLNMPELVDARC